MLLKEQGLHPVLWLEYVYKGDVRYFNGFYTVMEHPVVQGDETPLFIRVLEIEKFTEESLKEIREINRGIVTIKTNQALLEPYTYRPESLTVETIQAEYFDLVYILQTPQGEPAADSGADHYYIKEDCIDLVAKGVTSTISYDSAIYTMYQNIMPSVDKIYEVTKKAEKGYRYFVPPLLRENQKEEIAKGTIFKPSSYDVDGGDICVEDPDIQEGHWYSLDLHMTLLRAYQENIKGLKEFLDKYSFDRAAAELAGTMDYEQSQGEVVCAEEKFKIGAEASTFPYVYILPDKQIVEIGYETEKESYMNKYPYSAYYDLEEFAGECMDTGYSITPLDDDADATICRINNILLVYPLYVSSVECKGGNLDIKIHCMVNLGEKVYQFLDIPLHLVPYQRVQINTTSVTYTFVGGTLRIPSTWYEKIDRSKTLEESIQLTFADQLKGPAKYSRCYE